MTNLLIRGLVSVVIGGLVLGGARVASASEACQERAELHYALAESAGQEGVELDAAWEDTITTCEAEQTYAEAMLQAHELANVGEYATTWVEYAPGGWVAVGGDADGNPLFSVAP